MSVKVMGRVWDSGLPPNERLVLLAIADAAEHDGTQAYPGDERLMAMTGYSRSQLRRIVAALLERGVLVRTKRGQKYRRAEYVVVLDRLSVSQDATRSGEVSVAAVRPSDAGSVSQDATLPESLSVASDGLRVANCASQGRTGATPPVLDPSSTPVLEEGEASPTLRRRDLLWETYVEIHGPVANDTERASANAAVKKLRDADVTPDELVELAGAWSAKFSKPGQPPPQLGRHTIANRVGELRHFLRRGPLRPVDVSDAERRRRFAELEQQERQREALG